MRRSGRTLDEGRTGDRWPHLAASGRFWPGLGHFSVGPVLGVVRGPITSHG